MSLQKSYVAAVARQLQRHAVWEPGNPISLGDFGILVEGTFKKLGSISDFGIQVEPENSTPSFWEFTSTGVSTNILSADAKVPIGMHSLPIAAVDARGTLEIKFKDQNSLFIRANQSTWTQMKNLRDVAIAARSHVDWEFNWRIVTGIRNATTLLVLMNSQSASTISLKANVDALLALQKANVSADSNIEVTGDAALKIIGKKGPFLLDIAKVNRFPLFGQTKHASGGALSSAFDDPHTMIQPNADLNYS